MPDSRCGHRADTGGPGGLQSKWCTAQIQTCRKQHVKSQGRENHTSCPSETFYLKRHSTAFSLQTLSRVMTCENVWWVLRSELFSNICARTKNTTYKTKRTGNRNCSPEDKHQVCRSGLTWPSRLVCSTTTGISFFSTLSMPNRTFSTNRDREKIRLHPVLMVGRKHDQ